MLGNHLLLAGSPGEERGEGQGQVKRMVPKRKLEQLCAPGFRKQSTCPVITDGPSHSIGKVR